MDNQPNDSVTDPRMNNDTHMDDAGEPLGSVEGKARNGQRHDSLKTDTPLLDAFLHPRVVALRQEEGETFRAAPVDQHDDVVPRQDIEQQTTGSVNDSTGVEAGTQASKPQVEGTAGAGDETKADGFGGASIGNASGMQVHGGQATVDSNGAMHVHVQQNSPLPPPPTTGLPVQQAKERHAAPADGLENQPAMPSSAVDAAATLVDEQEAHTTAPGSATGPSTADVDAALMPPPPVPKRKKKAGRQQAHSTTSEPALTPPEEPEHPLADIFWSSRLACVMAMLLRAGKMEAGQLGHFMATFLDEVVYAEKLAYYLAPPLEPLNMPLAKEMLQDMAQALRAIDPNAAGYLDAIVNGAAFQ